MIGRTVSSTIENARSTDESTEFRRMYYGSLLKVGAAAAVVALDQTAGHVTRRRHDDEPRFLSFAGEGDKSIYVVPGCRTDGELIADMMQPQLRSLGDTTFVAYPRRGFSIDAIREGMLDTRSKERDKRAVFIAISMGGLVVSKLLEDADFCRSFGDVETIVYDSSPADIYDVRRQTRIALGCADAMHRSWALDTAVGRIMTRQSRKQIEHETCVSDEQLRLHLQTTARAPLHMVHSQGNFIKQARLKPDSLAGVAERAYYVSSVYDNVINTDAAFLKYATAFGGQLHHVVDEQRPHGSHASGPAFQKQLIDLIAGDTTVACE